MVWVEDNSEHEAMSFSKSLPSAVLCSLALDASENQLVRDMIKIDMNKNEKYDI